jgi:parvulin-like peptidyl-prolyl isomerase
MSRYRLPERVEVSYVKFPLSNFLAEATKEFSELTNLNEIVEARYQQLGTNFFLEAKTPEEKKEKIREVLFKNQMLFHARKKANEFATAVFAVEPMRADNLETLAKGQGLTVQVSSPFDKEDGPKDLVVAADFTKAAFGLTASEPFAGPLTGDDGAYVIALKRRLASENPPFEAVRDQVMRDYQFALAVSQARQAGIAFHGTLTNGLAGGKSFTAICTEAKLDPEMPPALSLSTRSLTNLENHVSLYQYKQAVFTTPPGKASVFIPTADGGFIVFVQAKLPLDEVKRKADLPAFMNSLRQARLNEAFNEWLRREADRGFRDIPYFNQKQTPQISGAPKKQPPP